jgi:signal transduction histidine kinase
VKNPLGAAAGYAQLLEEGIVGELLPKQREMVARVHRLVNTAVQTVSDLLELARADGELRIEYTEMDISEAVNDAVADHEAMATGHRVTVSADVSRTMIVADTGRVRQILSNLISNAIKYTPAGGRVDIRLVAVDASGGLATRLGVEVRDNGPGIPPELSGKLFEEFFRVRNSNATSIEGNGLGLAISRRIARLMAGDITFANGDGGGSVFTLWLTAAKRAA